MRPEGSNFRLKSISNRKVKKRWIEGERRSPRKKRRTQDAVSDCELEENEKISLYDVNGASADM